MRGELIAFFAPRERLVRSALIAVVVTALLLQMRLSPTLVPYIAAAMALGVSRSSGHVAIAPVGDWHRAWPMEGRTLLWTRAMGAWLTGWAPCVASQAYAAALWALGAVSTRVWLDTARHTLFMLGLIPLVSVVVHRFERDVARGAAFILAAIALIGTTASIVGSHGAELDPSGAPLSITAELSPAIFFATLLGLVGVFLAPSWLVSPAPPMAVVRAPREPLHQVESAGARASSVGVALEPPGDSNERGVSRSEQARQRPGHDKRFAVTRFFYFHSGGKLVWLAGPFPVVIVALSSLENFPVFLWFIASSSWLTAYGGLTHPAGLPAHLPVSRDRILFYLLAPLCVTALLGLTLERFSDLGPSAVEIGVHRADRSGGIDRMSRIVDLANSRVLVPSASWRASWGEPPLVTTPEGLSRRPSEYPLIFGLPLSVYNPYEAWIRDDARFVLYQVSRALSDYRHADVSRAEIERACPSPAEGSSLDLPGCLHGELDPPYRLPPVWIAIKWWLLSLSVWFLIQLHLPRPRWRRSFGQVVGLVGTLLPFSLLLIVLLAVNKLTSTDPTVPYSFAFYVAALLGELAHLLERAPLWSALGGTLSLAAMYWHTVRTFRNAEPRSIRTSSQGFAG